MKATIFDYGAGNLFSLRKALLLAGVEVAIETNAALVAEADLIVLPGVGAFGLAAERLRDGLLSMRAAISRGTPCLGICLGMQLLFDSSEEGDGEGLGIFSGRVTQLAARRVPQIGWNVIEGASEPLLGPSALKDAYFANGFACRPSDEGVVTAWTRHETDRFPAIVRSGRVVGVQFHPEKSSSPGLEFIRSFVQECGA